MLLKISNVMSRDVFYPETYCFKAIIMVNTCDIRLLWGILVIYAFYAKRNKISWVIIFLGTFSQKINYP